MSWNLSTKLFPNYEGALMDARFVGGGFRIVNTQSQMLSIPYLYRTLNSSEGTIVFLRDSKLLYQLITNPTSDTTSITDWEVIQIGGTSSLRPVGTWDPYTNLANTTDTLADAGAVNRNGEFYFVINTPLQDDFIIAGLFQDQNVTLVNGSMVVSMGSHWIAISSTTTWDAMVKPQVINDYVNGIVQAHTHEITDIIGLGDLTGDYYDITDTADHTIPFDDVLDTKIVEVEFLREWYYTNDVIDSTFLKKTGDSGVFAFTFASNQGIDTDGVAIEDVLNIGTTNADIINIGRVGGTVNFPGTVNYQNEVNLAIEDKLIRLNVNGAAASGFGVGFEIEEDALITGYFKTNATRDGYLINAPGIVWDAELMVDLLTASRSYSFPDADGTLALAELTLSTSLDSAKFWLGNGSNIATQRLLSGDATLDNLGALTIANDAVTTAKILNSNITFAKIQSITTDRILGRDTAGTGVIEELLVGGGLEFTGTGIQTSAFTGDVTKAAGGTVQTIANDAVTYAKIQDVTATSRFLGRITAGAGIVEELTGTEATTLLNTFTDALKGLTPASGGGTSNFLRADGTWVAPGGSGHTIFNGADVGALTTRANLRFRNGLEASDDTPDTMVELGGVLTKNTVISGSTWLTMNNNFGLFSSTPDFEEGDKIMFMGVCTTPPTTPPTAGVFIFVQLINSNYELRIMDSAGNIKGLS